MHFSSQNKRALFILCACLVLQFVTCLSLPFEEKDNDSRENDDPEDGPEDDGGIEIELGTGAIVGIVIGILALLIAIPILLCFCCGCFCFKEKKQKIIGVTPSATLRKQYASEKAAIGIESSDHNNHRLSLNTPISQQRRDSQFSSATAPPPHGHEPGFTPYPLDDNLGTFYYNLGFEPPPPYAFSGEDREGIQIRYSDAAWATSRNGGDESRAGSARPSIETSSKLGPSLIAKGRLG